MREVFRGFRLKIRQKEQRAGEEIERIFSRPTFERDQLAALNARAVAVVSGATMDALKEGVKFGKFIAAKTRN